MADKTIIWDMDGVLINSEPRHYRAWKENLQKHYGIENLDYGIYKKCIGGRISTLQEEFSAFYGVDIRLDDPEIRGEYLERVYRMDREEGFPATAYIREVVRELKARGYHMCVASSSPLNYVQQCVAGLNLEDCFEHLFSGEQVAHAKPAPDVFIHAAEAMGSVPENCAIIEDSNNGVRAAKAAGGYCIGFINPDSGDQDLSLADTRIHDMRELLEILQ